MHVFVVYICPENNINSMNTQLINFSHNMYDILMASSEDKVIILGDFNLLNLIWILADDGNGYSPSSIQGTVQSNFMDDLNACNLLQNNFFQTSTIEY